MNKNILNLTALITITILISSCQKNNEEAVFKALENNPEKLLTTIEKAVSLAKEKQVEKQNELLNKEIIKAIDSPLKPQISEKQLIRGPIDAPITIVEYSDFECPFCSQSKNTMRSLEDKYPGKIRFVFKHLPLSFHPAAMISAQYYEAIRLQDPQKAFEFHDKVFKNQSALKNGEAYLAQLAENLGVNIIQLNKDLHSNIVLNKIQDDIAEASKFEFNGTPGFVINGVPVKGAYPLQHFEKIIHQLQNKGKLVL